MTPFLFIVPRMPVRLRNELRESMYETTIRSLLNQKSKNWKALILGKKEESELDNEHFIYVEADDYPKTQKLAIALDYIDTHPEIRPEYIIRLDTDDIMRPDYLNEIEKIPEKFDLYYDEYHVCIDPVYMKISYRKNNWVANTAIHKYEHALKKCGPENEILFLQDHDAYWHQYYSGKKVFKSPRLTPLYFRILTPYSITSSGLTNVSSINWQKHLSYLNSYGPWLSLHSSFHFYSELKRINSYFEEEKPSKPFFYWLFNSIKHYRNLVYTDRLLKETLRPSIDSETHIPSFYQECTRCILTTKDTVHITFDNQGICNYCRYYDTVVTKLGDRSQRKKWIGDKILQIKKAGQNKEYDCILGVSGGVDSTYLSYWAKEHNLRPLVVHFDNGWNSELATSNIRQICDKLGFSLNTYVINWEEFRELQLAYMRAGVIDIEALTDHAITATIYKIAAKYKIRYTLNGFNYATEAVMPKGWVFDKGDWENIKDIYRKFGDGKKIRTFPHIPFPKKLFYHLFLRLESIQVLNYIDYNKEEAKAFIAEKLAWRDYGGKHYESVFTKFYQAYILPVRFGVDKRKAHLSNLICSGQMTKEAALLELQKPLYAPADLEQEKEYVLKKLGLSDPEFDKIMDGPRRAHQEFKTEKRLWNRYFRLIRILKLQFR